MYCQSETTREEGFRIVAPPILFRLRETKVRSEKRDIALWRRSFFFPSPYAQNFQERRGISVQWPRNYAGRFEQAFACDTKF